MPRRPRARLWTALSVVLLLACYPRDRRDFCQRYADAVVECCPDQDDLEHVAQCRLDTQGGAVGCSQAGRDLYDCFERTACDDDCTVTALSCAQEYQGYINVCSATPGPPGDPP